MRHIYKEENFGEDWFTFPDLYSRMVRKFPSGSTFVEVGSWKGKSSAYMAVEIANSNKEIRLYCVDTWEGSREHRENASARDLSGLYRIFLENMRPAEHYYIPLKISSLEASRKFKDNSLDFVFLDASHEYEDVKDDILAWLPKVKPGGFLAGHDYYQEHFPGVKKAADQLLGNLEVSENCFIYHKDKLNDFPPVNFISTEESAERRESLLEKFGSHGIKNITGHIFKRYEEGDCVLKGDRVKDLGLESKGTLTSHLKAIKKWYLHTNEPYAFFCEDGISLETVKYWNFTWKEFFESLPKDWGCVQLAWMRERFFHFGYKLRNRCWCDWSGCAYLISREHARRLIETYHPDQDFQLDIRGEDVAAREDWAMVPVTETVIFSALTRIYSIPLFAAGCNSTYREGQGFMHMDSRQKTIEFWMEEGRNMPLHKLVDQSDLH